MTDMSTSTEKGWKKIFEELNISEALEASSVFFLSAEQIKNISGREPRLMAKFDTRESRPETLRKANCTILPIRNGEYALVSKDGYCDITQIQAVPTYHQRHQATLQTLPLECASESQVIDSAVASGVLKTILEETSLALTVRGRLRSPSFSFFFDSAESLELKVDGVQIEIDAGFEGNRVYIIEAKMGTRADFITRQLYYPWRMWKERGVTKEIVPLFLTFSNKVFSLTEYRFSEETIYSSLELVKQHSFTFAEKLELPRLADLWQRIKPKSECGDIPFPQANDLRKVIDIIDAVGNGLGSNTEIANFYGFVGRQSAYYGSAARYLGFLSAADASFLLTGFGKLFRQSGPDRRILMIGTAILEKPVFYEAVRQTLLLGHVPVAEELAEIIARYRPELNDTTPRRRASTLRNWIIWLKKAFG